MKKKVILLVAALAATSYGAVYAQSGEEHMLFPNSGGPTLGYTPSSGVTILTVDGKKFKDLNRNGKLDKYEDWQLPVDERAADLARRMSLEEIAGLMLYSAHQAIPAAGFGPFGAATYKGKPFAESGANPWDLTDAQRTFLRDDNLRHVLITRVQSPEVAARWNNTMQAFVEGIGLGIPANNSSDPRHAGKSFTEFDAGAGGDISIWPDGLAMAATFDPAIVQQFGIIAAMEYRALGITTALSPQIDLGTEPRWYRTVYTFGESPRLSTDMARAYVDGFQTSVDKYEINNGWGYHSVNAMVKHWPGGGPEEGGRDGHWAFGKFAVYPGGNFADHLEPFTEGAFKLRGKTGQASAVMPYYTISYNQSPDGTNHANGFSRYIINDLLRTQYGYDGVVCTDWGITGDEGKTPDEFRGKPWGVEELTVAERHYQVIMAGVDQFGGNNVIGPIIEAWQMGVKEHGEKFMRRRFEQSAVRLLRNIFRVGLFENPYIDPQESARTVGNPEFMQAGYNAQLKSVVMLKNKQSVLPVKEKKTVYIPQNHFASTKNFFGEWSEARTGYIPSLDIVRKYYNITTRPGEADFALVFAHSPTHSTNGYDINDRHAGGNGYVPISLQYGPYTATEARAQSIAAGDPVIDPTITNRSYKNKTITATNAADLETILNARKAMPGKPVIVVLELKNPMIFSEFESVVDGLVVHFGTTDQAVMDIISGRYEPSGLLPLQMPANMTTVERQCEDLPFDMDCHVDSEGNIYDFAFGLNWKGVINDARVQTYKPQKTDK